MWIGKLVGTLLGSFFGIPIGSIVGCWLGHQVDVALLKNLTGNLRQSSWDRSQAQQAFFEATFSIMGHIAKADGRISKEEIRMAETVMTQMRLNPQQRQIAIALFNEGKQAQFPWRDKLLLLKQHCRSNLALLQLFVEIQYRAAQTDGLSPAKQALFSELCQLLGLRPFNFGHFKAHYQQQQRRYHQASSQPSFSDPYEILGLKPDASDQEVKRAYRKLMSQHHPDKLVAQGLPEEMIKLATEKTQHIKQAYEEIRLKRGFR